MNRRDLERHLRKHGFQFHRHASKHDIWLNPFNGATAAIPRHRQLKITTARAICRELGVPVP
jgi:predicted RNA binding protein YcfA (HicA-like mRNA interferase family)